MLWPQDDLTEDFATKIQIRYKIVSSNPNCEKVIAKICSNLFASNGITAMSVFHLIWIVMEKSINEITLWL